MTISLALRRGMYAASRSKRLWFIYYAALTVAAIIPTAAAMSVVFASLGHSAWAEQLGRSFDFEWIGELMAAYGGMPMQPVGAALFVAFFFSSVMHVFLIGGTLELFVKRQMFSASDFFAGCGRYFWRMLRLSLWSLVFYAVVLGINRALDALGEKIWGEGSEATPLVHWGWFRAAVLLLLVFVVNLIFDYASIALVSEGGHKTFRAVFNACRLVWRNLRSTTGLAATLWAIKIGLIVVYFLIAKLFPQTDLGPVVLLLIVRQAMVLAKIWSRLLFYASQSEMYESL